MVIAGVVLVCVLITERDIISRSLLTNHAAAILLKTNTHKLINLHFLIIIVQILRLLIALVVLVDRAALGTLDSVLVEIGHLLECGHIVIALLHLVSTILLVEVYLQFTR